MTKNKESYWLIGQQIVENELQGAARAEYGKSVLKELAESMRQLDRQISTLYYERLLASKEKAPAAPQALIRNRPM